MPNKKYTEKKIIKIKMDKGRKMVVMPLSFSIVEDGVYRSGYPNSKSLPFIQTLNLKLLICLCPNELRGDLEEFASSHSIELKSETLSNFNV